VWKRNDVSHWHESESGEVTDSAEHSFVWSGIEGTTQERGECSVCGFVAVRESELAASQNIKGKLLIGLGTATAVLMMLYLAAPKKRRNRRR